MNRGLFLAESEKGLHAFETALVGLENGAPTEDCVGDMLRVAHTLKGHAMRLDLQVMADFAHALEDVLGELRESRKPPPDRLASLLLRAVDVLQAMLAAVADRCPMPGTPGLFAAT
jgi:chemotaxis protein histidine kinase CheA